MKNLYCSRKNIFNFRCSDSTSRHRHHTLSRGSDNGFETLQRKDFGQDHHNSSCQYQTSVFQDNRVSPDVIPDSFTHINNKCQEFTAAAINDSKQVGFYILLECGANFGHKYYFCGIDILPSTLPDLLLVLISVCY